MLRLRSLADDHLLRHILMFQSLDEQSSEGRDFLEAFDSIFLFLLAVDDD